MAKMTIQDLDKPQETVVEETQVEETVVETTTETHDEPNIEEVFKTKFKGSVEEFNNFLNEVEAIKTERESLRQAKEESENKAKTFEQKLKEWEETGAIDDEQYYKLAQIKKTNPEKAKLIEKVLFGEPTQKDLLKLKIKQENPLYADKEEMVEDLLEEEYGISLKLPDEDDDDYETALKEYNRKKNIKEMKLTADAEGYKKSILAELDAVEVKKPKTEEAKQKEKEEYVSSWQTPFKTMMSELSEIKITDKGDDGEEVLYTATMTEAEKEVYFKPIAEIIMNGRFKADKETIESLKQLAVKEYVSNNIAKIVKEAIGKAKSEGFEYYRKKVTGGEPIKNGEQKPTKTTKDPKLQRFETVTGGKKF